MKPGNNYLKPIIPAADAILDFCSELIYPSGLYCICCGNIIDDSRSYHLCDHCIRHIRWNADAPLEANDMQVISCVEYGIYERSIIFALKYDGHKYIAETISEIMVDRIIHSPWKEKLGGRVVVPVPLSKERLSERGYNHAELIASKLVKRLNRNPETFGFRDSTDYLEFSDALMRIRDTLPMKGLGPRERLENIDGSIRVKPDLEGEIQGKNILLIDDFFTTGSTGMECAKALKEGGAEAVNMLTFASRKHNDLI